MEMAGAASALVSVNRAMRADFRWWREAAISRLEAGCTPKVREPMALQGAASRRLSRAPIHWPRDVCAGRGERLVRRRTSLGLSQKEAAKRLGVDPGTLARWERGERANGRVAGAGGPVPLL